MATLSTSNPAHHFAPESALDPAERKRLRALLEKIDYEAYHANVDVIGRSMGRTDIQRFRTLAAATAQARARWVKAALAVSEKGEPPTPEQTRALALLREAYDEMSGAYEAMRRMVERGYLMFSAG